MQKLEIIQVYLFQNEIQQNDNDENLILISKKKFKLLKEIFFIYDRKVIVSRLLREYVKVFFKLLKKLEIVDPLY